MSITTQEKQESGITTVQFICMKNTATGLHEHANVDVSTELLLIFTLLFSLFYRKNYIFLMHIVILMEVYMQ